MSYISGFPVSYISKKTKRFDLDIKNTLKAFGVYVYDPDDGNATDILKALGWLVADKMPYSHSCTTTLMPGTSQVLINESHARMAINSAKQYIKDIPQAKRVVYELGLSMEEAWRMLENLDYRKIVHDNLVEHSAKKIVSRCDIFSSALFDQVCNVLDQQDDANLLHSIMSHYYNGGFIDSYFNVSLYMSTFDRLGLAYPLDRVKNVVKLRIIRICISSLLDRFYRCRPLGIHMGRYMSSILGDDFDCPEELGFDFKEGFKSFLDTGVINSFPDNPESHENTFMRWVRIFNSNGGYDRTTYRYIYPDDPYPELMVRNVLDKLFIKDVSQSTYDCAEKIDTVRLRYESDFFRRGKWYSYPHFVNEDEDND